MLQPLFCLVLPQALLKVLEVTLTGAGALFILWECSTPFVYLRW